MGDKEFRTVGWNIVKAGDGIPKDVHILFVEKLIERDALKVWFMS